MIEIDTNLTAEELRPQLERWGPWRLEIQFSNGLNTLDFGRKEPFQHNPLSKIEMILAHLDPTEFHGGSALDIGVNVGYNSLTLATDLGMTVWGIDVTERNLEVAELIVDAAGVLERVHLIEADATTYRPPAPVDLVLHLGTLYHLPNPMLSIETTAANLRSGGLLALETQIYIGHDQSLSKFIHGFRGDPTNFWALSRETLLAVLDLYGFDDVDVLLETDPSFIGHDMARILLLARRR
jgi:2-polyprenyl-3-methyl-5-hydroxy-6-metoxy-1,4-benzoquinol methylase